MHRFIVERWTGRAWDSFPGQTFKTMGDVLKHLKKYSWHYTPENPYRIADYKPKKKVSRYSPKYKAQSWNSDVGMAVQI
jgi:hypothetical protein